MPSPSLALCPDASAQLGLQLDGACVAWVGPLAAADDAPRVRWSLTDEAFAAVVERAELRELDRWVRGLAMPRPLLDALAERCALLNPAAALLAARGQLFVDARWRASLAAACVRSKLAEAEAPTPGRFERFFELDESEKIEAFYAFDEGAVALLRRKSPDGDDAGSLCWLADGQPWRRLDLDGSGLYSLLTPLVAPAGCFAVAGRLLRGVSLWVFDTQGSLLAQGRWPNPENAPRPLPPYRFSWHEGALWLHTSAGHIRLALVPEGERSLAIDGPAPEPLGRIDGFFALSSLIVRGGWLLIERENARWMHLVSGETRALDIGPVSQICHAPEGVILGNKQTAWLASPERPAQRLAEGHFWRAFWGSAHLWLERHGGVSWLVLDRRSLSVVADHQHEIAAPDGWVFGDGLPSEGFLVHRLPSTFPVRGGGLGGVREGLVQWIYLSGQLLVFEGERLVSRTPWPWMPTAARSGLALTVADGLWAHDAGGHVVHRVEGSYSLNREELPCAHESGLWVQSADHRSLWRWTVDPPPAHPSHAAPITAAHRDQSLRGDDPDRHAPGYTALREDLFGLRSRYEGSERAPSLRVGAGSVAALMGCTLQGPVEVESGATLLLLGCELSEQPEPSKLGGLLLEQGTTEPELSWD